MVVEARLGDFRKLEVSVQMRTGTLLARQIGWQHIIPGLLEHFLFIDNLYPMLILLLGRRIATNTCKVAVHCHN